MKLHGERKYAHFGSDHVTQGFVVRISRREFLTGQEFEARYDEVLGNLASERVGLEKKIEDLRTYEKEYRGRLKSWISDQLAQLDGDANREKATAVVSDPA